MSTEAEQKILEAIGNVSDRLGHLETEVKSQGEKVDQFNDRLDKVDSRLWTLCLSLIGTSWAAIFAAAGVVIFRTLVAS